MTISRILRLGAGVVGVALMAAAAQAQVTAEALARLQTRADSRPNDANAQRALGIALYKLGRFADAESALQSAARLRPRDGVTALYLGLSAEERGDLTGARTAYTNYLSYGRTRTAQNAVSQRLAALSQRELEAAARAAVAQEQRLAAQPGTPNQIAVLPVAVSAQDPNLAPLGRGLADLMISDFGKVPSLQLLERDRVQAILDEIAASEAARGDPATVVRSGRLLQAGRVVNGSMTQTGQTVQLNTSVVSVASSQAQAGGTGNGTLNDIFDVQKTVVLQTIEAMGIELTPAQRREIQGNRPTTSLQAFLAYSRGLTAMDAGRLDEAANFFDNARALDPGFSSAASAAGAARAGVAGQAITTAQIEGALRGSSEGQVVASAERGATGAGSSDALGTTLQNALADVNPSAADAIGRASTTASVRDAAASSTGREENVVRTATVTIVIKRP